MAKSIHFTDFSERYTFASTASHNFLIRSFVGTQTGLKCARGRKANVLNSLFINFCIFCHESRVLFPEFTFLNSSSCLISFMMKHFHPLFSTNAFAILSVGTLLSAIPNSLTINRQLVKRAGIPDLNELPPPEDDTAEHPSNQQYGLESIAPVKRPRSDLFRKKKMRRIEDLVRSIPPFSDQSQRQNLLTSAKERAVEEVNRAKSSTREKVRK